jgi:hypothetical protein
MSDSDEYVYDSDDVGEDSDENSDAGGSDGELDPDGDLENQ